MAQKSYRTESSFRKALKKAQDAGSLVHWYGTDHGWVIVTKKVLKRNPKRGGGLTYDQNRAVIAMRQGGGVLSPGRYATLHTLKQLQKKGLIAQVVGSTTFIPVRKNPQDVRVKIGKQIVRGKAKYDVKSGRMKVFVTPQAARKLNPTTYGTSYFVSLSAAVRYYRPYGDDEQDVQRKIKEGQIHIGKPPLKGGQKLHLIDGGTRYAITES